MVHVLGSKDADSEMHAFQKLFETIDTDGTGHCSVDELTVDFSPFIPEYLFSSYSLSYRYFLKSFSIPRMRLRNSSSSLILTAVARCSTTEV